MRQLAERYVCDRGRLVVECLSCGKRKETPPRRATPPVTGVLFLCQRSWTGCAIGPGSRSNIPPTARVVTAAMPKTTPYVMSTLSRWQRSYGRLYDGQREDVLQDDHGFFHTIGSC